MVWPVVVSAPAAEPALLIVRRALGSVNDPVLAEVSFVEKGRHLNIKGLLPVQ